MLHFVLFSFVVGTTLPIDAPTEEVIHDIEEFEQADSSQTIPVADTVATSVAFDVELLPAYTKLTYGSGTTGKAAIATNGLGLQVTIDPTTIDIAFLQLEPAELKAMKDAVNTIDFAAKMTGEPTTPPLLEFAIVITGTDISSGETGVTHHICFSDTMDKVEQVLGGLTRRLQTATPSDAVEAAMAAPPAESPMAAEPPAETAPAACVDDLDWTDAYGDTCGWYAAHDPGCTYYAPAPSYGQFEHCPKTCSLCTVEAPPPGTCGDDPAWTDSYGDTCSWYAYHDPGCTSHGDYGQFAACKATCNTCMTGPDSYCPPEPEITFDGATEKIHYCFKPEEHFAVFGPNEDAEDPYSAHLVTDAIIELTRSDETTFDVTYSFTGPESPMFELKGAIGFSEIIHPSPTMTISMPMCTEWMSVAMLMPEEASTAADISSGHFCDYTSPDVEPCCLEQTYEGQDACLAAAGTGTHFCADPTVAAEETCCMETTYAAQDECLANKGITYNTNLQRRKLGAVVDDATSKKIALDTLKKLHAAHHTGKNLFEKYKEEKARLVRRAYIEYSVVAVFALVCAAGAWRYLPNIRKFYAVAPTEEEAFDGERLAAQTE
jgi:hypothetical protein